jgi:hypothetical protein
MCVDKAVQDNIVESWLCIDCGVNTSPGSHSGPEVRAHFATGAQTLKLRYGTDTEIYDVNDDIWEAAGMRPWQGCLCIGCLEKRIGRRLRRRDFSQYDREIWAPVPCTERLRNRRGLKGPPLNEVILELNPDARRDWSNEPSPDFPSWEEASRAHPADPLKGFKL